ncbi:uncharacterized protein LOC134261810 [Saccostrea cucullata]|uniref:uncharacterized protein LOC134261810 n=1 Tax=Saccostrea cuccullata TaxID=36930 RepID=UPI002ED0850B
MAKVHNTKSFILHLAVMVVVIIGTIDAEKCQSGRISAYSYPVEPFYPVTETVIFDPPFSDTPSVMYALNFIDVNYAENFRVNSSLLYVDKYQAQLQMSTWHDTKLYGIGLSWMACP